MADVNLDTPVTAPLNSILAQQAGPAFAQAQSQKQEERKVIREDILPQFSEQSSRRLPPLPQAPPTEPPPKPQYTDPIQAWGSLAMGVAMLGSAFTRQPLVNALNAGAAVNNAFHRNDLEASRQSLETWRAQTDYAQKLYEYQDKTYRDALLKLKDDRAGTMAELRALAVAYHDDGLLELVKMGQIDQVLTHITEVIPKQMEEMDARKGNMQMEFNDKLQKLQFSKDLESAQAASTAAKQGGNPDEIAKTDEDLHRVQQKIDNYHFVNTRSGTQQTGQPLTDEEVDYYAKRYKITGQLPPLYRDTATRTQIIKRAADMGGSDVGSDIARAGGVRSDQASLTNITRIADSAEAYENTALSNMTIVEQTMPKGTGTNFGPWLDRWVQTGRVQAGDPNVPPYATALVTVANEYAKVMQGATGSMGSTDASRREAADLLNMAQTTDQVKNVMDVMKQDMENKKASYRAERASIQNRIRTGADVEAPLPQTGTLPTGAAATAGEFSKATIDDLLKAIDNPSLTNDQRRAIDARLKELGH